MLAILAKKTPLLIARKEIPASVFDKGTRITSRPFRMVKMFKTGPIILAASLPV